MLSIVIPIFNEEKNISILVNELLDVLKKIEVDFEILIIDDGSTDNTPLVLQEIGSIEGINVIRLKRNYGKTSALHTGFEFAKGEIIVTLDGDLQDNPKDIPKLLKELDNYDLVYGVRTERADPLFKVLYSKWANFINNRINGAGVKDSGSPLKAFKKNCLKDIKLLNGMHRFFPHLFIIEGYEVIGVEVTHRPRIYGKSKYNFKNRCFFPYIDMFMIRWMKKNHLNYEILD